MNRIYKKLILIPAIWKRKDGLKIDSKVFLKFKPIIEFGGVEYTQDPINKKIFKDKNGNEIKVNEKYLKEI